MFDAIVYIHGHGDLTSTELTKLKDTEVHQTTIFLAECCKSAVSNDDFIENDLGYFMQDCFDLTPRQSCHLALSILQHETKTFCTKNSRDFLNSKGICSLDPTKYINRSWQFHARSSEGVYLLLRGESEPIKIKYARRGTTEWDKEALLNHLKLYDVRNVLIVDSSCLTVNKSDPPTREQIENMLTYRNFGGTRKRKLKFF